MTLGQIRIGDMPCPYQNETKHAKIILEKVNRLVVEV
jgi:hypothetical protein